MTSSWLIRRAIAAPRLRLYCFCYAGGNAVTYLPWQAALAPAVEVCAIQLPGRGARLAETLYRSMTPLVDDLVQVIAQDAILPFAFFGHSLGGLLAFEVARHLARHGLPQPQHLFVSGSAAPQYRSASKNLHTLPDNALIEALGRYNGTPAEILQNRELMELVLPTIRADFALVENYTYQPGVKLSIPITVLAGTQDDRVSNEQANAWALETSHSCKVSWFEGDHFFINPQKQAVLDCILDALRPLI